MVEVDFLGGYLFLRLLLFCYAQCRGSAHDELAGRLVYGGESAGCGVVGYVCL